MDNKLKELYGITRHGGDRNQVSIVETWSTPKTAEFMNKAEGGVYQDLQLAKALNLKPLKPF